MFNKKSILGYSILLIIILSSSFACSDNDGYSLGKFRISIATAIPEGTTAYSLLLDDGTKLWPAATAVYYRAPTNQRVFVNYTLLSDKEGDFDHYIKVNDIWNVLTKPVIDLNTQNADSIGNDPVRVNEMWVGNNYLNTSFSFNYSGVKPHAINMVLNTLEENNNGRVLELELRHNSFESESNRLFDGFACFDLKPFRIEGKDSIPIVIKYKDWDGDKTYELMYKYNDMNLSSQQKSIPTISSSEYN